LREKGKVVKGVWREERRRRSKEEGRRSKEEEVEGVKGKGKGC
jgi:hypothetical protein